VKIKKSFIFLGIGLLLLSLVSAVQGYEVDTNTYRLKIATMSVESKDMVRFYLINPISDPYSFYDMHSYTVKIRDTTTTTKFSHSPTGALPVQGTLGFGEKKLFTLPYDPRHTVAQELECGRDVTVEMFDLRGVVVARWVGIPKCNVRKPRMHGLLKINNCSAEYFDGTLKIEWELTGADNSLGMVKLKKKVGRQDPVEGWYDSQICPDLIAGKCMTVVSPVFWGDGNVSVTLYDKRQGTHVTLVSTDDVSSCYKKAQKTVVVSTGGGAAAQATATQSQGVTATQAAAKTQTATQTGGNVSGSVSLLKANASPDVRVCLEGCKAQGQCYDEETRANYLGMNVYCKDMNWLVQKADGKKCSADHECSSGKCTTGLCGSKEVVKKKQGSWLTRLLLWVDNLI
jgi:hypothetical protein